MNIYYDKYNNPEKPTVYLCTPNNHIICALNGIDEDSFNLTLDLKDTSEISFDVNRYINIENEYHESIEIESNGYSMLSVLMRIYVDGIGWFIMDPPKTSNNGINEVKSITAISAEIEMQQHDIKKLKINKGTTDSYEMLVEGNVDKVGDVEFAKEQIKFYNPVNPKLSFLDILLDVSNMHGWRIGYIDDVPKTYKYFEDGNYKERQVKLSDEIGSFDIEAQDLYSFLTQDASKFFSCIFVFDILNFTINVYRPENLGKDTNINIGFRNLQNSNDISVNEDVYTRYYVTGADDLGISYVNFGTNYIENIDYFKNEKYMSAELIEKYNLWKDDCEAQRIIYIENTRLYNKQQAIINELYNRLPLDDCSTDWSKFSDEKLLQAQANYQAQKKGYESFYVDSEGRFDEAALMASPDANDYCQIRDVILPSIQIEIDNRKLPPSEKGNDYIDTYKTDWKLYGLDELQVNLDIYKNNKKLAEDAKCTEPFNPETSDHTEDYHTKMYEMYKEAVKQLDPSITNGCQYAYNQRKSEVDEAERVQKTYDDARKGAISKSDKLTWSHNLNNTVYSFNEKDLSDLSKLYVDCDYNNDNMFITSSDDAVTAIDEQLKLMDAGVEDLYAASQPQYVYSTSLDNFLALYEYKDYTNNLNLGDYIYLGVRDDYVSKMRVIKLSYNPLTMDNNLNITFSNMIQGKTRRDDFVYLLDKGSGRGKNNASGNGGDYTSNEGVGLTPALIQKLVASSQFINELNNILNGGNINLPSSSITLKELNAKMIKVVDLFAKNGFFEYLQAKLISVDKIVADSGNFKKLSATVAAIDNLLAGNISAELGHIIELTAQNVRIDTAVIRDMIAAQITVSMLQAGTISANKFNIKSDDGGMEIVGNTMQFKDKNGTIRIQIGRDSKNNFTFCLYDETGKGVLIDSTGIKDSAIADGLIVNNMIANNTIGKEKFNFSFLETDDSGNIVKDGKVVIDKVGIDAQFTTIQNSVTQIQGQIDGLGETLPVASIVVVGNESQNIPCDSKGNVLGQVSIEIPFIGYAGKNRTDVTATVGVLPSGMTIGSIKNSTPTTDGVITLNIEDRATLGDSNVLSGKINLRFIIKDRLIVKQFNWCKAKQGENGSVDLYELNSSVPVVFKDSKGTLSPSSIKLTSSVRNGNEQNINPYLGVFIIKESTDGVVYNNKYISSKAESETSYTISSNDVTSVKCILTPSASIDVELDVITIPVISDNGLASEITEIRKQMGGISSNLDAVNKKFTDKVWQTDITTQINNYDGTTVNGIRDRVTQTEKDINGITNTVSDVETALTKKADGSTVQALTERVSKAEQDAEGFKQTVEQNYIQKNDLQSSSRNLIRNSKNMIYKDYYLNSIIGTYITDETGAYLTDETGNILTI